MEPEKVKKIKPQEMVTETLKCQTAISVQMSIDAASRASRIPSSSSAPAA
jgi:hypothetical protein